MNSSSPFSDWHSVHTRQAVVLRLPHFHNTGGQLSFLISNRPHALLTSTEQQVWSHLQNEATIADLTEVFGDEVLSTLARFVELGVCVVARPAAAKRRRRILVIEPHGDDAALSVGGTMWLRRDQAEFTVATVFSRSNYTSYFHSARDYFDVDQVTALRAAESDLFGRLIAGRHLPLGLSEATLRYRDGNWSVDWFRQNISAVYASNNHRASTYEFTKARERLRECLFSADTDEVWIPMGAGTHSDHHLTRDACLSLLMEFPSLTSNRDIRLYQDVPYDAQFPEHPSEIVERLRAWGAALTAETVSISDVFAEKLRLVSLYASQFKIEVVEREILASAEGEGPRGSRAEHLWTLERLPISIDTFELSVDRKEIDDTVEVLRPKLSAIRSAQTIRLLMLVPAGQWSRDITELLQQFPKAQFQVFMSPAALAEAQGHVFDRVQTYAVTQSPLAWIRLALKLAFRRAAPIAFVAGIERQRDALRLTLLWRRSTSLVVPSMDHLVTALRRVSMQIAD